ncbi:MAG TPA: hypothetical protein VHE54_06485 [Puia sp.]|nr:hypothetical protein [Puia sp.]
MSLNDVILPGFIIGELYGDSLLVVASRGPAAPNPGPADAGAASKREPSSRASKSGPEERPRDAPAEQPALKFLGSNRRHFTILVQSPGSAFLPDDQLSFLTKILEACRMNIGDVAIVNAAAAPVTITALKQQLQPATILLFGMEPISIRLPINFPVFRLQPYDNCTYLAAPPLELLVQPSEESRLLKSKLWLCLKTLFNV